MIWSKTKPNKNGLWMWRIKGRKCVGVIKVSTLGKSCEELTVNPTIVYNLDAWWNGSSGMVETRFVGDSE